MKGKWMNAGKEAVGKKMVTARVNGGSRGPDNERSK